VMHNEVFSAILFYIKKKYHFINHLSLRCEDARKMEKKCIPDSKVEFLVQKYECDICDYS